MALMFGLSAGYIGSKGKRQGPEVRWDGVGGGWGAVSILLVELLFGHRVPV